MSQTSTTGLAQQMRFRLAQATPSRYLDGIVVASGETSIDVALLEGGVRTLAHGGVELGLAAGMPVAVHEVYGVLAADGRLIDVARLDAL